jgi:hypothetical protein
MRKGAAAKKPKGAAVRTRPMTVVIQRFVRVAHGLFMSQARVAQHSRKLGVEKTRA